MIDFKSKICAIITLSILHTQFIFAQPPEIDVAISILAKSGNGQYDAPVQQDLSYQQHLENTGIFNDNFVNGISQYHMGAIRTQELGGNAVYDQEQTRLMALGSEKLNSLFPSPHTTYTVGQVYDQITSYFQNEISLRNHQDRNYDEAFAFVRKLRHLQDSFQSPTWKTPNNFGDMLAASSMVRLISIIRENTNGTMVSDLELKDQANRISSAFYELSQSYSHVLSNLYKIAPGDFIAIQPYHLTGVKTQKGISNDHLIRLADFNREQIKNLRRDLLVHALKLNPENLQAQYRLLECLCEFYPDFEVPDADKGSIAKIYFQYQAEPRTAYALSSKKPLVAEKLNNLLS